MIGRTLSHYEIVERNRLGGRVVEAIDLLEQQLDRRVQRGAGGYASLLNFALAEYELALAYESSGWRERAIEQFERFLEIWRNADPGTPEAEDAKLRLAELRS